MRLHSPHEALTQTVFLPGFCRHSFPRTAHVHSDVRMLMATTAYREGSEDSMRADVHITNMGANSAVSGW